MEWLKNKTQEKLAWILIIISGIGFRLYPLITKSFWEDELWNYYFATNIHSFVNQIAVPVDDRPPLYFLFLRILTEINTSEFFLRLPSLISGIAAVLIIALAVRKYDKYLGIVVAFFLSFSIYFVNNSWQQRDYGILVLFIALIISRIIHLLSTLSSEMKVNTKDMIVIALLFSISTLTNHLVIPFYLAVVLSLLGVMYIYYPKVKIREYFNVILMIVPSVIISAYYIGIQFLRIKETTDWIPSPSLLSYLSLTTVFAGVSNNFSEHVEIDLQLLRTSSFINIAIFISIFIFIYLFVSKKNNQQNNLLNLVPLGISVYILNLIGITIASKIVESSLFVPRTFIASGLFFLVILSISIGYLVKSIARPESLTIATSIIFLFFGATFFTQYTNLYGMDSDVNQLAKASDNMMQNVEKIYSANDQILIVPEHYNLLYFPYNWREKGEPKYSYLSKILANKNSDSANKFNANLSSDVKIIIVTEKYIIDPEQKHYSVNLVEKNKYYLDKIMSLCKSEIKLTYEDNYWMIKTCKP